MSVSHSGYSAVACMQGKVIGLDVRSHGKVVSSADVSPSVDMIAFYAKTHHLFAPNTMRGLLTVTGVSAQCGPRSNCKRLHYGL
jgi:hypothetical protein